MRRFLSLLSGVVLCLAGLTSAVLGQVTTETINGFTIATGSEVWLAEESPEGGMLLANTENAMNLLRNSEGRLSPNEYALSLVPPSFLAQVGITGSTAPETALSQITGLLNVSAPITPYMDGAVSGVMASVRSVVVPSGYAELYMLPINGELILVLVQVVPDSPGAAVARSLLPTIQYNPDDAADGQPGDIVSGKAIVDGILTSTAPVQTYRVNLAAGDIITIELAARDGAFDAFLSLYTEESYPNGSPLVSNDDSGDFEFGTLNSRIADFAIATSGNYIIEVTSLSRTSTGEYQLGIDGRALYALVPVTITTSAADIVSGSAIVSGELTTSSLVQAYRVNLAAGDIITIELAARDRAFDAFLSLYTEESYPNGSPLVSNDDSGDFEFGTLNSRIADFAIATSGNYIIEVTSLSRISTGEYQLGIDGRASYTLTLIEGAAPSNDIVSGSTIVSGELTRDSLVQAYRVNLAAGDIITIELAARDGAFDAFLSLYTEESYPNGSPLVSNDDSGDFEFGTLNSRIADFAIATSGNYIIEVTSLSRTSTGEYQLGIDGRASYSLDLVVAMTPATTSAGSSLRQWAASATGTSQYGSSSWSFSQATGAPNTNACGDLSTAWASATSQGRDTLTLTFTNAVVPSQVNIHQTYTPGSITQVEVGSSRTGEFIVLPNSADPPGNTPCPGVFTLNVTDVSIMIDMVRITLDQTIGGNWNEIDAVELVGSAG